MSAGRLQRHCKRLQPAEAMQYLGASALPANSIIKPVVMLRRFQRLSLDTDVDSNLIPNVGWNFRFARSGLSM